MKEKAKSDVGVQGYKSIITNYKLQIMNGKGKPMKNFVLLMGIALCVFPLTAQTRQQVDLFSLNQVRLLESPFLSAQQTDLRYLLTLELDRLLSPFLREAGLQPKAPSYPNWKIRGWTVISAGITFRHCR